MLRWLAVGHGLRHSKDYQVVSFRVPQQVLQLKSACLSLLLCPYVIARVVRDQALFCQTFEVQLQDFAGSCLNVMIQLYSYARWLDLMQHMGAITVHIYSPSQNARRMAI